MSWLSTHAVGIDVLVSVIGFAANWMLQSTLLVSIGLLVGALLRKSGSAAQSLVYRTTLAAALVCPVATFALSQAGYSGWAIGMPQAWVATAIEAPAGEAAIQSPEFNERGSSDMTVASAGDDRLINAKVPFNKSGAITAPIDFESLQSQPVSPGPFTAEAPATLQPVQEAIAVDLAPTVTLFGKAVAVAALAWLAAAGLLAMRLLMAWWRLASLRKSAIHADSVTRDTCRLLSDEMDVAAPEVRCSPYLPSPCLSGIRKPAVLLPEAELCLPVRDVLIHELAHLRRHDCFWNLLRQLATALFFFHPLLWVLSRRIETTAEEVCDDFVVQFGGNREEYAHRLVNIAELSSAPFAAAGVGIVSLRSMLARRVTRIMDTSRSLSTRVGNLLLLTVLMSGLAGVTMTGLIGLAPAATQANTTTEIGDQTELAELITQDAAPDDLITVRGQVVKPNGQPMSDADVYVLRYFWDYGDKKPLSSTKADQDGRFEISYRKSQFAETAGRPNQWRETCIAAFARGYGIGWAEYDRLKPGEGAIIRLAVDDVLIEGRVIDLEGKPVVGATVEVGSIDEPKADTLDEYLNAIKASQAISTAYRLMDGGPPHHKAGHWPAITTDSKGVFRVSGVGRERIVKLHVSGPTIVSSTLRVATRRMEPIVHPAYASRDADSETQYGSEFHYTAAPSRAITGVVRDADSGEPISGAEVWSWRFAGENISGITTIKTKSDNEGRYRLNGMPKGKGNEVVVVPTDLPYFTAEFEAPDPPGIEPVLLDIELHRGKWVTGRVTDKATGSPVAARMHYMAFPDNKLAYELPEFEYGTHCSLIQNRYRTDADGRYRVVALPGHGIIGVRAILDPYPVGQGFGDIESAGDRNAFVRINGPISPSPRSPTAMKEVRIVPEAEETVLDFALDSGSSVALRAVDPRGRPMKEVDVVGVTEIYGSHMKMDSAEFELTCFRPDEERTVLLSHPERRLGKALRIAVDKNRDGPLEVTLEPMAIVTGRLTRDGAPVPGLSIRIDVKGDSGYGRSLSRTATDKEGVFHHEELLPGLDYSIYAEGRGLEPTPLADGLTVMPGETIDLGTIDVNSKERPEPKRSIASQDVEPLPKSEADKFAGKVVDPDGNPAAGAELFLVFHIPEASGRLTPNWKPLATTNAEGGFRFTVKPSDFGSNATAREFGYGQIVATHPDFGFASAAASLFETSGEALRKVKERLKTVPPAYAGAIKKMLAAKGQPLKLQAESQPIRGRIVDINGQPVAGAKLTLLETWTGVDGTLDGWTRAAGEPKADYYSARMQTPQSMNGPQLRSVISPATTDADGRFRINGIGDGKIAWLLLEGPGIESAKVWTRTEAGEAIKLMRERRSPDLGFYTYHSSEFTHVAGPSVPITGVVRDAETKDPLAGITVKSQRRHGEQIGGWGQDFVRAVTDKEGRYRLEGMPIGKENSIAAIAPSGDTAYFSAERAAPTKTGEPTRVDFDLRRGIWVEGHVTDKQSGKGLPGRLKYYFDGKNPNFSEARSLGVDERDRLRARDDGGFRIAALPGVGYVAFLADDHETYPSAEGVLKANGRIEKPNESMIRTRPSYLMTTNYHVVAEIDPAEGAQQVRLDLEIDGGSLVVGRVTDPAGKPVAGYRYAGRQARMIGSWRPAKEDRFELLGYDREKPRHFYFVHQERQLAGHAVIESDLPADLVVQLQPAGRVTGRLVDQDGVPLPDCQLVPYHPPIATPSLLDNVHQAAPLPHNTPHSLSAQHETDAEGRFEIAGLAPGVEYQLRAFDRNSMMAKRRRAPKFSGPLDTVIKVEPGESKDLGDVRLLDEKEFAKRAEAGK
ncbi:Regulatory protein BlaR1 [Pseudobythopirellula maris]|uniref:Regulatory protein BlaR1 n=1 Tax=Pseudobythopirellula maris TaxID=2527991 RepID=A0A5C5ZSQ8_9BACT|nr:M56 family metallopeptidase [Pseudobythopirellula maris]TWT90290.1 Regulatory protein BlaR1 [Pseudobythopirellula maris]